MALQRPVNRMLPGLLRITRNLRDQVVREPEFLRQITHAIDDSVGCPTGSKGSHV